MRRAPEGLCAALVETEAARDALLRFAGVLDEVERPLIALAAAGELPDPAGAEELFGTARFDRILAREPWRRGFGKEAPAAAFSAFARQAGALLAPGGSVALLESPPRLGERLSRIIREECGAPEDLAERFALAEESFYSGASWWTWEEALLEEAFTAGGFRAELTVFEQEEERLLTEKDLSAWFDRERSAWGKRVSASLGEGFDEARSLLAERLRQGPLTWKWRSLLLSARKEEG
jgi:putative ATPase